jgi:hypothetical protein
MGSKGTSRRKFLIASAASAVALPAWSTSAQTAASDAVVPFSFRATDATLMDLKRRIDQTRWPERETGTGWAAC